MERWIISTQYVFGHCFIPPVGKLGYTRVTGAWRRPYKTKDGYLCMMAYTERHWRNFWAMVGKPEICDDPRFNSISTRSHNVVTLYELAGACLAAKTTDEWLALLRKLEIPAACMASLDGLKDDPQLKAGGFFKRAQHPSEGEIRDVLSGHLCRCTGYAGIMAAALEVAASRRGGPA